MTSAATSNRASCVYGSIRRSLSWVVVATSALALGACGGGNGTTFGGNTGGGDTATTPAAADLIITLSATSLPNTGTDAVTVTVTAVDSSRVAIGNVPVTISADNNAVVEAAAAKTAATTGRVTAAVRTGSDRSNRVVTVTASANTGALTRTASFSVVGAKITASVLQAVIAPSAAGRIQYRLTDVNSNPMPGSAITVSGAGIATANGVTDSSGSYTFDYVAPVLGGSLDITARAGGVESIQTVIVQTGVGSVPSVVTPITSASVSANPSVIPVNTSTSNNRAEIRALFVGAANTPIPNVRVKFDLAGNLNSIDGTLASEGNVVLSDANGVAATAYISGTRSSPTDGVTVRACYYLDDAAATAGGCANFATTTLTVISEPLAISIGTNRVILGVELSSLTYSQEFVVFVVDASGQAKSGVVITPSIDLVGYRKGFYNNPGAWSVDPAKGGGYMSNTCGNEDANRNGVVETLEDINKNGSLEPRKSDVAISAVGGSAITDASGIVKLKIEYPKNVGAWVDYRILVSASGVSGTEGRASWSDTLGVPVDAITAIGAPPFVVSPYGFGDPLRTPVQECAAAD